MAAPSRSSRTGALACGVFLVLCAAGALAAPSRDYDIGSAGQPTITGSLGGRVVVGDPSLLADLSVTVDLGELSPVNRNSIIKVVVPIAIRSDAAYQLEVDVSSGGTGTTLDSPQLSDVGFGIQNLQQMGRAKKCALASHRIMAPFANDPAFTVSSGAGRASFPSSLATVGTTAVIMQGPQLSTGNINPRTTDNGWRFDAVFALVPQFFAPGTSTVTLTFRISASGTNWPCL
ncbi:hypothetical protein FGE12_12140 [Aggregicoccus sp. 17bor-14]|uniref:hypothetical protein n=1 Tax=Myxococcaceae TaxID=31 RepID=UPI00129C26B5|nr:MULTISPECIES: hypothetical protein [Myxococcaceae]MBF5043139.1 hypothetical protein [Simulacricoccus sp. 17bor-14]MRI88899.1 hypothetical protein [Aggregicoccus sp. 17bor-14]